MRGGRVPTNVHVHASQHMERVASRMALCVVE